MIQLTSKSLILLMLILVCSCSVISPYKVPIIQGNIWEEDDIEKLNAGLTKEQVQFTFGTAVIIDPFRTSRWDYINSVQIGEKIVQENKLTVFFNEDDLVEEWILEKAEFDN
jgi:outer membrane protein assembly factor BamE